jgi:hypothetical protein
LTTLLPIASAFAQELVPAEPAEGAQNVEAAEPAERAQNVEAAVASEDAQKVEPAVASEDVQLRQPLDVQDLPAGRVAALWGFDVGSLTVRNAAPENQWAGFGGFGVLALHHDGRKFIQNATNSLRFEASARGVGLVSTGTSGSSTFVGDSDLAVAIGVNYGLQFVWSGDEARSQYFEFPIRLMTGPWATLGSCHVLARAGYGGAVGTLGPSAFKTSYGAELSFLCPALGLAAELFRFGSQDPVDSSQASLVVPLSDAAMLGARGEMMVWRSPDVSERVWSLPSSTDGRSYQLLLFLRLGSRGRERLIIPTFTGRRFPTD